MRTIDPNRDWKMLLSHLPQDYEQLAIQCRLFNPQWSNAKVTSFDWILRMILLHVGADLPLRQTVACVAQGGGPSVSQVWLHQKMRRAEPYLATLVQRMVSRVGQEATPERWAGYEMVCLDGSTVSGPGAEGADARIHGVLRLHDLRVVSVHVTNEHEGETLRRFTWVPDELVIVDRGYANAPGIAWVVDHGADVLVRVNRGSLPLFDEHDQCIDVLDWCRKLTGHRAHECAAKVIEGQGRKRRHVAGRLIGFRLPDREAAEARERVRREQGAHVTEEQLEAASYVILFTTAPAERLSAARCVEAYRLRWQLELQWKRWKSLCHFDRVPNYRDDTIRSWLTAKVLLGLVLDKIGSASLASPQTDATSRPLARQPWKLTAILWPLIVSALIPIRLAEAATRLPDLVVHLDKLDHDAARHQVQAFRDRFYTVVTQDAAANY